MLIVLTSEQKLENEAYQINQLFHNGLEILHLRKPTFYEEGYCQLLNKIDNQFHNRIILHEYHNLCDKFNLRGIHIQEQSRIDLGKKLVSYTNEYKSKKLNVSSSFHSISDIVNCPIKFDYVLLSPVFSSISKSGYEGKQFDVSELEEYVIGMGGIKEETLQSTFDLGFKGVGVLGGIWNSESSILSFISIKSKLLEIKTHMYNEDQT